MSRNKSNILTWIAGVQQQIVTVLEVYQNNLFRSYDLLHILRTNKTQVKTGRSERSQQITLRSELNLSEMEVSTAISRCAHMIHNSDDVDSLQEILLELSSACIYAFPSTFLPKGDRTFLMASAKHGRYKCCKLILSLDSAATINLQNSQGYTALHYAAYGGNTEIAFLLLAAGAKVDIRNIHGETAYETAVSGKKMELLRRFQASQYYDALVNGANNPQGPYLTENVAQELTENDASTTYHGAITRRDALMHHMEITAVDVGAESTLVGQSFHCLSSEQQRENVEHLNKFSGATCAAFGSIGYYPSEDLYIGRARSNHVCISDLSLSKQHAVISYYENVGFLVYDMGSKHGTFIDGERIIAQAEVKPVDNLISSDRKKDTADSDKCGDVAEDTAGVLQSATPAPTPVPTPATQYLKEGMEVRFGRIHCKVVRKRQDAVISSG